MSVKIIEPDVRPEKGVGKDEAVITLSKNQVDCYQADPRDFVVLTPEQGMAAEVASHGQHGLTAKAHKALLKMAAAVKGLSPFRSKPE